jgi:hypothetical protein
MNTQPFYLNPGKMSPLINEEIFSSVLVNDHTTISQNS